MGLISNATNIFDAGAMASGFGGSMTFISSQTASNSASISFTTGITSTYKEYQFYFVDINPATDQEEFKFQGSTDGGSNYGVTITSAAFRAYHVETDDASGFGYHASGLAQSTAFQSLTNGIGNDSDESCAGSLTIFNPSSTTYVKHFISRFNGYQGSNYSIEVNTAGYFNTTSAINAVQFKFGSGNFDGTILMYGIN